MERQISFTLPSPTDTPFRTPSSSVSRRSHYEDLSPTSTPPPLPCDTRITKKRSHDSQMASEENLSPLDPRRFTPTLHANLVSEILSLRRELENKTKSIDHLEQSLDAAQSQNEGLSKSLLTSNKEIRSVKRQMQLLEGGTLSAIGDLSRERDDALDEATDLRKRLEQTQKRARSHEDSADRIQALWEREKDAWALEKRALETKTHIAENRLKTVLEEFALFQAQTRAQDQEHIHTSRAKNDQTSHKFEDLADIPASPTSFSSPEFRRRRHSAASSNSERIGGRTSALSFHGHATNLADELDLSNIEEDTIHEVVEGGRISPDALLEERERPSSSLSIKARKVLGLTFDIEQLENQDKSHSGIEAAELQPAATAIEMSEYIDSAVQYSPPLSPVHGGTFSGNADGEHLECILELDEASSVHSSIPVMVSSSCQTVEYLPSPPLTPSKDQVAPILVVESVLEKSESRDMSTQTDIRPRPGASRYVHSRTSTHDLGIPVIAIIPPTSRPVTPETIVMLPPQTKNASCQVDPGALLNYTDSSIQTEEIRIDKRNVFATNLTYSSSTEAKANGSKGKTNTYPQRTISKSSQPVSNSSSKRSTVPINDNGPLAADSALASSRPVRSSSLFAGFDDYADDLGEEFDEDIFYEDEYSSRPTAKFTLRSGKLVSQESPLEEIGELTAVSAGEAVALDNLRRSESTLPLELRQFEQPERPKSIQRQSTIKRAPSTARQANVRRTAMISNGVAAHQARQSQSTNETMSVEASIPPPIPIPLRYSSARIGKSYSEGGRNSRGSSHNTSPTRQYRHKYKPVLRKARSGPAISPSGQTRRPRSKSPPTNSRISIVPEMPQFQMPGKSPFDAQPSLTNDFADAQYESSTSRIGIIDGKHRSRNHVKQPSDPALVQQTSVVDAISQTMVGEWLFKYVRRRKSFGKPDKDWDPNKSVEELTSTPTTTGVRHKRWVWLAPYERAVMWSSKQPMNGTALLGKSGRKLVVKSVLDVRDENPMPKNSLTGPVFNRSILILTPQRALKFTATNQERHFVWLTALSFLSHSPLSIGDLAALPPPPDSYRSPSPPPVPVGGSFRRRTLRDSIRIAKGANRQEGGQRSITDSSIPMDHFSSTRPSTREFTDHENDAAFPPTIRRFHTRNRSNTAPKPLVGTYLPFSQAPTPYHNSNESGAFEQRQHTASTRHPASSHKRRGSEASAFGRPNTYNNHVQPPGSLFSDSSHNASMTMRMDAFVDNKQAGKGGFRNLRLGGLSRATNKDLNFWGGDEPATASTMSPVESITPANTGTRLSDSAGRVSSERDFFRGF